MGRMGRSEVRVDGLAMAVEYRLVLILHDLGAAFEQPVRTTLGGTQIAFNPIIAIRFHAVPIGSPFIHKKGSL